MSLMPLLPMPDQPPPSDTAATPAETTAPPPDAPDEHHLAYQLPRRWSAFDWLWFIGKNLLGWTMMIAAGPLGIFLPGPGGLPLFIIGFALVTFPGKRKLTARVLRGKPVSRDSKAYIWAVRILAFILPAALFSYVGYLIGVNGWFPFFLNTERKYLSALAAILYISCVIAIWSFGIRGVHIVNLGLRTVPMIRRRIRPWLRNKGLDLLPPRRRRRMHPELLHHTREPDEGILEIHERHHHRLREFWKYSKPWFITLLRASVVVAVFTWMVRPIVRNWDAVKHDLLDTNWWHFALAAVMFAVFLYVFRALVWRRIIRGMGYHLPLAPAVRIWSMSELARYIPGVIWQVVGRVYLSKPYGVPASASSASQFLELAIFMLANILVGLTCLLAAGFRRIPQDQHKWIFLAAAFIPVLLAFLHPRIFYSLLNGVMRRIKQPEIMQKLPKRQITVLALWTILGLLWQALAVWILTSSVLDLPLAKWYVLAGAYCLAWTIGFSVGFMFPGGMGIREMVFVTTLAFALPPHIVARHGDPELFKAFLGFLGVLLRLWAIAGELMMAGVAYASDYKGAKNRPDAPGRIGRPRGAAAV